jgi:exodeoxyribonuclease VII small subunit
MQENGMAKKKFEDTLNELEKIVQRLEDPDVPLEEAVALFEEGIKLSRFCSQKLDEVEKRVDILLKDEQGNPVARPFDQEQEQ